MLKYSNLINQFGYLKKRTGYTDIPLPEIKSQIKNPVIAAPSNQPTEEIAKLISFAKLDPSFSSALCCYEEQELAQLFSAYQGYRIPGVNGDRSVLLAACHFLTLQTSINRNMNSTMARQAAGAKALSPLGSSDLSKWELTSFGIEYQALLQPLKTYSSLAWGVT